MKATDYICSECSAPARQVSVNVIQEHRQAPRVDGYPMLYAPWEEGSLIGAEYETVVTCINGHRSTTYETKFFEWAK